jgi:uncharacterized RDD family membrane protein YckC
MNFKNRNERFICNEMIIAPIKKRTLALFIDGVVIIIIYCCLIGGLKLFDVDISKINVISIFDVEIETNIVNPSLIVFLKLLFGFLPFLYFTVLSYYTKGQTIGKIFLRIKIVSLYHDHMGFWHCVERSLGYFASTLEFGFGFIQAFWNPNRMTLHDKIGETIVISLPSKKIKR